MSAGWGLVLCLVWSVGLVGSLHTRLGVAATFHKNIRMVQRLYKGTDTKLKPLQGIISGFEESPEMINEAGKKFLSKRFIDLGKSLHALLWYQAQTEIWSIKLEVEHAERWLDLPEGSNPAPAHLSILPSEVKLIEDMGVQTIRMLKHCIDSGYIEMLQQIYLGSA